MWRGDPRHWRGRGHRQAHEVSRALCHHSPSLCSRVLSCFHSYSPPTAQAQKMFQTMHNCWSINAKSFSLPLFLFSRIMCVGLWICFVNVHSFFTYRLERLELILFAIPASLESSLSQLPHLHTLVVWPDTSHDIMVSCLCILWPCFCDCDVVKVSVSVLLPGFCVSVLWPAFCVSVLWPGFCVTCSQVSVTVLWPGFCVCLVAKFMCLSYGQVSLSVMWPRVCVCHVARFLYVMLPGFCICLVAKLLCLSRGQISVSVSWPGFCVCLVTRFLCLSCSQVSVTVLWPGFCVCLMARFMCLSWDQVFCVCTHQKTGWIRWLKLLQWLNFFSFL